MNGTHCTPSRATAQQGLRWKSATPPVPPFCPLSSQCSFPLVPLSPLPLVHSLIPRSPTSATQNSKFLQGPPTAFSYPIPSTTHTGLPDSCCSEVTGADRRTALHCSSCIQPPLDTQPSSTLVLLHPILFCLVTCPQAGQIHSLRLNSILSPHLQRCLLGLLG